MKRFKFSVLLLCVTIFTASHFAFGQISNSLIDSTVNKLQWRNIGPANMGGRIDDFAVVESNPHIIYCATASGGLWKTINT